MFKFRHPYQTHYMAPSSSFIEFEKPAKIPPHYSFNLTCQTNFINTMFTRTMQKRRDIIGKCIIGRFAVPVQELSLLIFHVKRYNWKI